MRARAWAIALVVLFSTGCKGKNWIVGSWLLIDESGKPNRCHTFTEKRELHVYPSSSCKGKPDKLLSGQYQLKDDKKLAIKRSKEKGAQGVRITAKKDGQFTTRGVLSGVFYRVDAKGSEALIKSLREKGTIKLRPLPPTLGCNYLITPLKTINALPKEKEPRMITARDQGLTYKVNTATGDPNVEKVVYALHLDQLEWISVHFKESTFAPPGPTGRMEGQLGKPQNAIATGKDTKKQHILMWKTYCENLKGQFNADVDLTLFSMPGKKQAYYYISEGIISGVWASLKEMAADPAAQLNDDDDDDDEGDKKKSTKAAPPKPAPVAKAQPKATPKAAPTPVAPKPAPVAKAQPKETPKAPAPAPKAAVAPKSPTAPPAPAASPAPPPPGGAVGRVAPPARGAASLSGRPTLPAGSNDI